MAEHRVTAATIASKVTSSAVAANDVILMEGTGYASLPKSKANLTYRAFDYAGRTDLKAVADDRGHEGKGFGVKVTDFLNSMAPGTKLEGLFVDQSGRSGINGDHLTASGVEVWGCAFTDRPKDGSRRIAFTIGDAGAPVSGFVFENSRWFKQGKRGDTHDHPFYFKNANAPRIKNSILADAGWFSLHMYPICHDGIFQDLIIWGSGGAVVFSSEATNPTVSTRGAALRNRVIGSLIGAGHGRPGGQSGAAGYLVEYYAASSTYRPEGNTVERTSVTMGGGTSGRIQPGLTGVTLIDVVDAPPEWLNGNPLVTGDFRQKASSPALAYGVKVGGITPPPPPAADTVGPTLTVQKPSPGLVVTSEMLELVASASDPSGVKQVRVKVGQLEVVEASAPYERTIDVASLPDGPYDVMFVAEDNVGNITTRSVAVTIGSPAPPPPPPDPCAGVKAELAQARDSLIDVQDDLAAARTEVTQLEQALQVANQQLADAGTASAEVKARVLEAVRIAATQQAGRGKALVDRFNERGEPSLAERAQELVNNAKNLATEVAEIYG